MRSWRSHASSLRLIQLRWGLGCRSQRCTPILSLPHDQLHPAGCQMLSLIGDVGLRGAVRLWQAVPRKFTRTGFIASVLAGAKAEGRRHAGMSGISSRRDQSATALRGRHSWSAHFSWSTRWRSG